jgi:hypothetical protein
MQDDTTNISNGDRVLVYQFGRQLDTVRHLESAVQAARADLTTALARFRTLAAQQRGALERLDHLRRRAEAGDRSAMASRAHPTAYPRFVN